MIVGAFGLGTCANDFEVFRELSRLLDPSAAIVESVSRRLAFVWCRAPKLFDRFIRDFRGKSTPAFSQPVALYWSRRLCFVVDSFTV